MGFWSDIAKPVGIGLGATALGSILFPQTAASLTGGVLGNSQGTGLFSGSGDAGGSSVWSNPTVLSSGILAGTSLLSGLFGSSAEEDAYAIQQANLAEEQRQFDLRMELEKAQLAQALEIAKLQASAGSGAAGAAAAAQRAIAKSNAIGDAANMKAQALQIPLGALQNLSNAAQTTGVKSGEFFNSLAPTLMAPALRGR